MKDDFWTKLLMWTLVVLLCGILAALLIQVGMVSAAEKITICHAAGREGTTHFVTLTLPENAVFGQAGHFNEDGTPQAGHEEDYLGPCESGSSTTTTSPSTTTSSPTSSTTPTSSTSTTSTTPTSSTSSTTPPTSTTVTTSSTTSAPTTSVPITSSTSGPPPVNTLPFTGMGTDAGMLSLLAGASSLLGFALVKAGRVR